MLNRKARRALKAKGIDMSMPRKEELKNEYGKLCVAAGELQYRIKMQERELHELNTKIENLNLEYAELVKAEQPAEVPTNEAALPTSEVVNG
jgi:archaellum component FlaC